LPSDIQDMISTSKISMGHARILSKLEDESQIRQIANKIINDNISVRETEEITSSDKFDRTNKIQKKKSANEYKYVEDMLRDKLDTKIKIRDKKIEIYFTNVADLNRILDVLDVKE